MMTCTLVPDSKKSLIVTVPPILQMNSGIVMSHRTCKASAQPYRDRAA